MTENTNPPGGNNHTDKAISNGDPEVMTVLVPKRLTSPHRLVKLTKDAYVDAHKGDDGILHPHYKLRRLNIRVSKGTLNRALRIMDALIKALESKGATVDIITEYGSMKTRAMLDGEPFDLVLQEKTSRVGNGKDLAPTGRMTLGFQGEFTVRGVYRDGKRLKLEDLLGKFIYRMEQGAKQQRQNRVAREERDAEYKAREQQKAMNQQYLKILNNWIDRWDRSELIRAFVRAMEDQYDVQNFSVRPWGPMTEFIKWALGYADSIDPLYCPPASQDNPQ